MKKLIGHRQNGRSTKLLYTADVMSFGIICGDMQRKKMLENMAVRSNCHIPCFITIHELLENKGMVYVGVKGWLVDDADHVLNMIVNRITGIEITALSMCTESEEY